MRKLKMMLCVMMFGWSSSALCHQSVSRSAPAPPPAWMGNDWQTPSNPLWIQLQNNWTKYSRYPGQSMETRQHFENASGI